MSYGSAIQFYGIDSVLDAYGNKGTPAFAIWCGKQLQMRYDGTYGDGGAPGIEEGAQLLRAYLEAIYQGSTAIYTLKTYDEIRSGEKIRPSTEYDTAFNFKLSPPAEMGGYMPGAVGRVSPLLIEIQKINARLDAREAEEDIDEDPETLQEAAIGLLNEPEKLRDVLESVKGIVDIGRALFGLPPSPGGMSPATMGAVTRAGEGIGTAAPQEEKFRALEKALNTLEQYDPALVDHLTKLATIAESNPGQFGMLLGILEKM